MKCEVFQEDKSGTDTQMYVQVTLLCKRSTY